MAKTNTNLKYILLKDDKQKLLETEKRLLNEGIIFKSRLLNHKKQTKNPVNIKKGKKDLSVKLYDSNNTRNKNNYTYNIPNSSKKNKSMKNYIKSRIKKNNKMVINKNIKNILNQNNYKGSKKNLQNRLNLIINYNNQNIIKTVNTSPKISNINLENGHISSIEKSKYYINTNIDSEKENINKNGQQKFDYKKWNKIIINNIFEIEKKDDNECAKKGIEDNINNFKNQKKIIDISIDKNKNKDKGNIIERNNIFNYCKKMSNLSLLRKNNKNYIGQILFELKSDQFMSQNNINNVIKKSNIHLNNNKNIKSDKSRNKKSISTEKFSIDILPYYFNFPHLAFKYKNKKNLFKNNDLNISNLTPRNNIDISINLNKNNNIEPKNNINSLNKINKSKEEFISPMNEHKIKIKKNNKLMENIKTEESENINMYEICNTNINNKETIFKKEKFEDLNEENNVKTKTELNKKEIFNTNTDLFIEKDKVCNFETKTNIVNTETSVKVLNNYNKNLSNIAVYINKNNLKDLLYSPKHNIFTKNINLNSNNSLNNLNKKNNDDKNKNIKLMNQNNNNMEFKEENKIDEKEVIFNIKIDKNNSIVDNNNIINNDNNKKVIELTKKCANQEKIISNLMENIHQLNSQLCNKDLFINELSNQIYSIKYDLLNTLRKTNSNIL